LFLGGEGKTERGSFDQSIALNQAPADAWLQSMANVEPTPFRSLFFITRVQAHHTHAHAHTHAMHTHTHPHTHTHTHTYIYVRSALGWGTCH